jgi:protein-disulfide isomerase
VGIVAANLGGSSPTVTEDDRVLGAEMAPVTIIEYGDFKCPFCTRFFVETELRVRSQYIDTGLVRLAWRDFPNIDAESPLAAEAGRCADEQDRFWEFHDTLYTFIWDTYYGQGVNVEGRSAYGDRLDDLAGQAGLDVDRFGSCLDDGTYRNLVEEELRGGQAQGVRGTPTFFVNGERVVGAQPFEVFRQLIDSKLPAS